MAIPGEDQNLDAAYHIEAIVHSPDKVQVYKEIYRVIKLGSIFA